MHFSYHQYTDDELLQLMKRHDSKAFEAIYFRYEMPLLKYALQVMGNKEDAADIIQEIFVSLWNRREVIHFDHSLKAWLYQAVRFQRAKVIRRHERKDALIQELVDLSNDAEWNNPHVRLEQRELVANLQKTISHMPVKMKEVFVLSRGEQLSHREISHRMNIAESTVKKQVQKALRFIREKSLVDFIFLLLLISCYTFPPFSAFF